MSGWSLTASDLDRIALGAGVLGTGGGGSAYFAHLRAAALLDKGHKIEVIHPDTLPDDALILALGGIGAPTVGIEKMDQGDEGVRVVRAIEQIVGRKVDALLADEIGGGNGLSPMIPAAQLGLPVVDCDGMGRAFPETQMTSFFIGGQATAPSALTDAHGNVVVMTEAQTPQDVERIMRGATIAMGCTAFMATPPMSGAFVKDNAIRHSVSLAWRIGDAMLAAQEAKTSPVDAILAQSGGSVLMQGKVTDVDRSLDAGFVAGTVTVAEHGSDKTMRIDIQNEFIVAWVDDVPAAMVPDLICIVDSDTGLAISTEELKYGLRVAMLCLPAPALLRSAQALEAVGPGAFGYDFDFVPLSDPVAVPPVHLLSPNQTNDHKPAS